MQVDFGRTAADYSAHRAGFPHSLFERLAREGVGLAGQRVLDLGTGTGTLARGFARQGCAVTALDLSDSLMAEAKRLDAAAGATVRYLQAPAEETGLPDAAFDVVSAGQCWHWFNRPRAAAEALRLLVPGGRLVIAYYDWIPLPGNMVAATEELILKHNPQWRGSGGNGIYPAWLTNVAIAGFQKIETFSYDEPALYSHAGWRGRVRASAGVAASLPADEVNRFDVELAALLAERFPAEPLSVPHRVFALLCRTP